MQQAWANIADRIFSAGCVALPALAVVALGLLATYRLDFDTTTQSPAQNAPQAAVAASSPLRSPTNATSDLHLLRPLPLEARPVQFEEPAPAESSNPAVEFLKQLSPGFGSSPQELPPVGEPAAIDPSAVYATPPGAGPLEGGPRVQQPVQMPALREQIPLNQLNQTGEVNISGNRDRVTLVVRDAPLNRVLAVLAQEMQLNIVSTNDINSLVTITLRDVPLEDALTSILAIGGYTWTSHRGIIHVTSTSAVSNLAPETQGRQLRVFPLHYALASDIEPVVRGLLSPVGKTFYTTASSADNRKTREALVVEDLPAYLDRVASFLVQADVPPRQVMIEAHVLQIDLKDENRHGVNLSYLTQLGGTKLSFELRGNANPMVGQAALFTFDGTNMDSLVELLRTTTDSKTLASPRVLVVNGQEARIQIGAQLGFRVTTTTQTSTLQSVNFLDVGVVLRVTPRISPSGDVMMHVKPEVSSGSVNPTSGLPEEETTEVETDILLHNGQGVVIGGLIQEKASDTQNKLPLLGDLPLLGRLFQHRQNDKDRSEIIIALVPRVVPFDPHYDSQNESDYYRATSPILDCRIHRLPRDDGYSLYDACKNPIHPLRCLRRLPAIEGPVYSEVYPQDAEMRPTPTPVEPLPPPRSSP